MQNSYTKTCQNTQAEKQNRFLFIWMHIWLVYFHYMQVSILYECFCARMKVHVKVL